MPRYLQVLFPRDSPLCTPRVCRVISEYADWNPGQLGLVVRVSFVGAIHDAIVIAEGKQTSTVLLHCGIALVVPRAEIAFGVAVEQPPDINPHRISSLSVKWFRAVLDGPRTEPVHSIMWLSPTGHDDGGDLIPASMQRAESVAMIAAPSVSSASSAGFGANRKKSSSAALARRRNILATGFGSLHHRVRCFAEDEDLKHPSRPPAVVYCKFHVPYLRCITVPDLDGYAREAAAYRLVGLCTPAVAPRCHLSHYHEADGSYACVLDDCVQWLHWHGAVSKTERNRHTGDLETTFSETLSGAKRIAVCLANLHSRFLVTTVAARMGREAEDTCPPRKDLRSAMVHEHVFESFWLKGVSDADFRLHISQLYNGSPRAEATATPPAAAGASGGSASPTPVVTARAVTNYHGGPQLPRKHAFAPRSLGSRLTLIHGDLCREHILMHPDPKAMPSVVLVDWKRCGVAPLEIDLVQLFVTLPAPTRCNEIEAVLEEYIAATRDLRPEAVCFSTAELLAHMRDTCLILAIGGPCLWNDFGRRAEDFYGAHADLARLTGLALGSQSQSAAVSRRSSQPPPATVSTTTTPAAS